MTTHVIVQTRLSSICEKPFPVSQFKCNKTVILLVIIRLFFKVSPIFLTKRDPKDFSFKVSQNIDFYTLIKKWSAK